MLKNSSKPQALCNILYMFLWLVITTPTPKSHTGEHNIGCPVTIYSMYSKPPSISGCCSPSGCHMSRQQGLYTIITLLPNNTALHVKQIITDFTIIKFVYNFQAAECPTLNMHDWIQCYVNFHM